VAKRQISERDENRLTWFFSIGQAEFFRSPSGAMLARAEERSFDSKGQRIPRKEPGVHYIKITEDRYESVVYEPELQVLSMFGWVSRRMRAIEQSDPTAAAVLERYYGDIGARWGKLVSIYPLTKSGRSMLRNSSNQFDLSAEARIGIEVELQKVQANDTRARKIRKMQDEAERMLVDAWTAWRLSGLKKAA
jgi:hypothetical protein